MVKTKYVDQNIQLQERPKPVNLHDVRFYAVTKENIDDFLAEFEERNGEVVFFALSVTDYEKMSLNIAELKRFIEQQKSLIIYYETNIKMNAINSPKETEEVVQDGLLNKIKKSIGVE